MADLSEYMSVYLEELEEQLYFIEEVVLQFEKEGVSNEGVQRMFRAAHTLKGSSAAMGYNKMRDLTHAVEHLLHKVRNHELRVTEMMINLFFQSIDMMRHLQQEIVAKQVETIDVNPLIESINEYEQKLSDSYTERLQHVSNSISNNEINDVHISGQTWFKVKLSSDCEMKIPRLMLIDAKLRVTETVIDMKPEFDNLSEDSDICEVSWLLDIDQDAEVEQVVNWVSSMMDVASVEVSGDIPEGKENPISEQYNPAMTQTSQQGTASDQVDAANTNERAKSQSIRVNVERLEQLMNLAGELVIDQTRIRQINSMFRQKFGADELVDELSVISDHLTRTIGELQEEVMKVRMLPLDNLFSRFPRMVRDLSRSLGKDIELIIDGKETELDRTLIDQIGDPLIHLLRNAIDHGIESPETRIAAGKSSKGTVHIKAAHEDNQVVISIEDDGGGIDAEKMRNAAISKGLMTTDEASKLSREEAIRLIFQPGFSTAKAISDVSGRGVGMDIVRSDIENMNGLIDIETKVGMGTIFKIRVPLTLAIITGLLVKADARTFVVPMSSVAEIVRIGPEAIKTVQGVPVITIRDEVIPLEWLHDYFDYPRYRYERNIPVVILGHAEKRLAIAVDELIGNQEIVIKSLGSFIGMTRAISGATILGNGSLALILDVRGLFH
ncbi:two-component system chemotaxis sensor kinase CheA [Fontibacillus solani]|uniref:Chemotaxis protein CheA n=1 Tax=Fontibacillus solani TaxID=1572857 RepID=A0A7W3SP45_9BACL|nr:chemotaxis protein CheA [Fontibacillus solani]MBA9083607.1 two-component system chemotaxis sensor kinase CheA [Fontibacillus solani]